MRKKEKSFNPRFNTYMYYKTWPKYNVETSMWIHNLSYHFLRKESLQNIGCIGILIKRQTLWSIGIALVKYNVPSSPYHTKEWVILNPISCLLKELLTLCSLDFWLEQHLHKESWGVRMVATPFKKQQQQQQH